MKLRMTCCILALFFLLSVLPSCRQNNKHTDEFYGMGTYVSVMLYGTREGAEKGFSLARSTVAELDALWSRTVAGSDISRLNESDTGISDADARTVALIAKSVVLSALTDGTFDITLADLTDLWELCGEEDRLPTSAELSERLARIGTEQLTVSGTQITKPLGVKIDLGAIAKGATAEIVTEKLRSIEGVTSGLVSFGSCVAVFGEKPDGKPYKVAIKNPKDTAKTVGCVTLSDGDILSVSGDYERYVTIEGQKYHHILDPKTGYPTESGLSSVAVVTKVGADADALSTAFMVMGEERTLAFYASGGIAFEAILIRSDGTLIRTDSVLFE